MEAIKIGCLAAALYLSSVTGAQAANIVLDGPQACSALGGNYTQLMKPPRLGRCDLRNNYTLAGGDLLNLTADVELNVTNYATLRINGQMLLAKDALLELRHASIENFGTIDVFRNAAVKLWAGSIINRNNYFNDGYLGNGWQRPGPERGILNTGTFENRNDGVVVNHSLFSNDGDGIFINYAGGRVNNYSTGRYYGKADRHEGTFRNDQGGEVYLRGRFTLESGGRLTNAGDLWVFNGSIEIQTGAALLNSGVLRVPYQRNIWVSGELESIDAKLTNAGFITLNSGGTLRLEGGAFDNDSSGVLDATNGKFSVSCTRLTNKGVINVFSIDKCAFGPFPGPSPIKLK